MAGKGDGDPPPWPDGAVEVWNILLGDPGPETRGPRTPGSAKAVDEAGGKPEVDSWRLWENWEERLAKLSGLWVPGGKSPAGETRFLSVIKGIYDLPLLINDLKQLEDILLA